MERVHAKNRVQHKSHKSGRFSVLSTFVLVLLILYSLSIVLPLIWMVLTSFKSRIDYMENVFGFPTQFHFENYQIAFDNFSQTYVRDGVVYTATIYEMLFNSLFYAIGGSFLGTLAIFLMAYAAARFDFKIGKVIYGIVIVTMVLPIVGSLPSAIQITRALGLYDSYAFLWISQFNFLGVHFLLFYEALKRIPRDYDEAGYIDGANNFTIMTRLIFPQVKGTFATIMLIKFAGLWNDYNITMEYVPNIKTLAFGLYEYSQSYKAVISSTPMRLAGCCILAIPVTIFFLIFHKKIMGESDEGGIKG
ncbi:MAG: carbohydrate ABC transporter permease [Candidatus Enteromonas sp.]|nr:carbohydrate ABC transporter permease [Candidatus Enteromonas sp.]